MTIYCKYCNAPLDQEYQNIEVCPKCLDVGVDDEDTSYDSYSNEMYVTIGAYDM